MYICKTHTACHTPFGRESSYAYRVREAHAQRGGCCFSYSLNVLSCASRKLDNRKSCNASKSMPNNVVKGILGNEQKECFTFRYFYGFPRACRSGLWEYFLLCFIMALAESFWLKNYF